MQVVVKGGDCGTGLNETSEERATCGDDLGCEGQSSNQREELSLCTFVPGVEFVEVGEERGELILRHPSYLRYSVQLDAQESDAGSG